MKEEFLNKIKNNEYISNRLYQSVKDEYQTFNIEEYNNKVLDNLKEKYKDYFQNMFKGIDDNIVLDDEQIKAILSDEDSALIIAGAGTGKTTTMTAKVKYLVDIKKVEPSKILVMSYTKKATQELEKRIVGDFNIPAHITTFHSLGLEYIRNIFKNRKCSVIDYNDREEIFFNYFCEVFKDKSKLKDILNTFEVSKVNMSWIFSKWFLQNYEKFNTFKELIEEYKRHKIEEAKNSSIGVKGFINNWVEKRINSEDVITIQGEYVKSASEAVIANFLYKNGIIYSYEKIYSELMEDRKVYKPDFTIDVAGEEIYIEYFGIDEEKYNKNKEQKIKFHKEHNNKFIDLDMTPIEKIEEELNKKIQAYGVKYNKKTDEEIYSRILDNNKLSLIYPFKNFFYEIINVIKESVNRENYQEIIKDYINTLKEEKNDAIKQYKYLNEFYVYYQKNLYGSETYKFDYSDLLYYANKYIENISINNDLNFEYIIIDEYQDISQYKYELAKKTVDRNHAKIYAVGDDWQSIYSFSGSRIEYTYNFKKYFKDAVLFKINRTYRNSQELLNVSGKFVMRNPDQIKKYLLSNKHLNRPVEFVYFDDNHEYDKLKEVILNIHNSNPNHNILVLGRTNAIINRCFDTDYLNDELGTKISFVGYEDIELEGMTIHKSKGLTFDEVIVIGLNKSFPSSDKSNYWIISLFRYPSVIEKIPYAEERRLFYVALTRTKNKVYLLVNKDETKQSVFINEIKEICYNKQ